MSLSVDEKIECVRQISDFTGHDIFPGNIVGVGRAGGAKFEAKLVTAVTKNRIYFAGSRMVKEYILDKDGNYTYKTVGTAGRVWEQIQYNHVKHILLRQTWSKLSKGDIQEHITLVQNPLFAINNPQIKEVIEIIDALKDFHLLPSNYKMGDTLMEYPNTEE